MSDTFTWAESRHFFDRLSDHISDWQGIPVMLGPDQPLVLAPGHPMQDLYSQLGETAGSELRILVSDGPDPDDEQVVNYWVDRRRNREVFILRRAGRAYALAGPLPPDGSMKRLNLWMKTIGAADAWDLDAEHRARESLRAMLTERQWRHYDLTGSFFETSPRSRVTYLFRRLRPTVAMTPRWKDGSEDMMRCLAVLCLHPIGYYADSWGGCLVPTDDVIAHLVWMRGDEADFWRHANQHDPAAPQAGL